MKKIVQFPDRYSENKIAEQVKNRLKNSLEDRLVTLEELNSAVALNKLDAPN